MKGKFPNPLLSGEEQGKRKTTVAFRAADWPLLPVRCRMVPRPRAWNTSHGAAQHVEQDASVWFHGPSHTATYGSTPAPACVSRLALCCDSSRSPVRRGTGRHRTVPRLLRRSTMFHVERGPEGVPRCGTWNHTWCGAASTARRLVCKGYCVLDARVFQWRSGGGMVPPPTPETPP